MQGSGDFNDNVNEHEFIERSFEEVEGGYFDGNGFYCTPEGSFWDENQVYFNREGRDRHGGYYDEYCIYHYGSNWNEEYGCYNDELGPMIQDEIKQNVYEKYKEQLLEEFDCYEKYFRNPEVEDLDDIDEQLTHKDECELFKQYFGGEVDNTNTDNYTNCQTNLTGMENNQQQYTNNNENCNGINLTNNSNNVSTLKLSFENKSNLNFSNPGFNQSPFNTNH